MPRIHRPIRGFAPSLPPVTSETFADAAADHRVLIVHFWAVWNGYDPVMDSRLTQIRDRLPHSAHLLSCNIDDPQCFDLAKSVGVLNIPWLVVFVDRQLCGHICGLREPDALASELSAIVNGGISGCSPVA